MHAFFHFHFVRFFFFFEIKLKRTKNRKKKRIALATRHTAHNTILHNFKIDLFIDYIKRKWTRGARRTNSVATVECCVCCAVFLDWSWTQKSKNSRNSNNQANWTCASVLLVWLWRWTLAQHTDRFANGRTHTQPLIVAYLWLCVACLIDFFWFGLASPTTPWNLAHKPSGFFFRCVLKIAEHALGRRKLRIDRNCKYAQSVVCVLYDNEPNVGNFTLRMRRPHCHYMVKYVSVNRDGVNVWLFHIHLTLPKTVAHNASKLNIKLYTRDTCVCWLCVRSAWIVCMIYENFISKKNKNKLSFSDR